MKRNRGDLRVLYAQAIYDNKEINRVVSVLKEHRTGMGKETGEFEKRVSRHFGKKFGVMVNSGSSANLLALELLRLPVGSEVITPLLTFSTTIAPLIQKGLVPVFVDSEEGTYVIDVEKIEKLITPKTKAIMVPLLIGNVPDMKKLYRIAKKYKLFLIEDSCDTFAAVYSGKPTGKYSDITITSFYGSHVITAAAGGGMLMVNNPAWRDRARVLRGWGRKSSLFGESESVKKRFSKKIGNVVYDAKFIFDEPGYNFLPLEISAAFGNAQLDRVPSFRKIRKKNFKELYKIFKKYEKFFIMPRQDKLTKTQWLAFPLTIRENAPFNRMEITLYLEKNNIQTRPVLAGNILKHSGFSKINYKIQKGGCPITDSVTERGFLIGCHQGLRKVHLEKIRRVAISFLSRYS